MSLPLYLYTGSEFGQRDDAVDAIKSSLKKKIGAIDEHLYYLSETPFSEVMTILQSGTLFSDGVCIVCKNAELLRTKDEIAMLSSWIESKPAENSVLILISDENKVDSKIDKLVPSENKKTFWEMWENQKIPWLTGFFQKNSYTIDTEACQLILDMIENDTQTMKKECSRFFLCFPKDHHVTCDDVESVLTNSREETVFSLFKQIANPKENPQKRFERALEILQKVRLSKDNSSVLIIGALTSCFRKLVTWHKICSNGMEPDEFTLKTKGFSGKLMQTQYRNAAKVWTCGQAAAILADLSSADMEIRNNGNFMEDLLLQKLLYEIILKNGAKSAVAEY